MSLRGEREWVEQTWAILFSKLAAIVAVMIVGRLNCLAENDPGTYPYAADDDPVESAMRGKRKRQIDFTFPNINWSSPARPDKWEFRLADDDSSEHFGADVFWNLLKIFRMVFWQAKLSGGSVLTIVEISEIFHSHSLFLVVRLSELSLFVVRSCAKECLNDSPHSEC